MAKVRGGRGGRPGLIRRGGGVAGSKSTGGKSGSGGSGGA